MRKIIIVALLLVSGFAHSQTVSFRVTDVDNIVIKNAKVTVDDTIVKYTDCMSRADIDLTPGKHGVKITHPSFFDYKDSINVTSDATIQAKLNCKWFIAKFDVSRNFGEPGMFKVRCGGTTAGCSGSISVILLKPGAYSYDVYTEFDTNTYSAIISNDTTIKINLPALPSPPAKNDTASKEPVSVGCSGVLVGSEAEDTIFVMDMSGRVVNVYDVKTTPADMIASDLVPGMYIVIAYPVDRTKAARTYKIVIN